jgi:hypothetical protein
MSELQHDRIADLCAELKLVAVPEIYGAHAQAAATKSASFSDLPPVMRAPGLARHALLGLFGREYASAECLRCRL